MLHRILLYEYNIKSTNPLSMCNWIVSTDLKQFSVFFDIEKTMKTQYFILLWWLINKPQLSKIN